MNYLAHGWRFADDPYFLAGTAAPDWLNVIDRKMRLRSKRAAQFITSADPHLASFARGVMQHHHDDGWFHQTTAFTELSLDFSQQIRAYMPQDEGFRPSFLGHILVELLLDSQLTQEHPPRLEAYYGALQKLDPERTQALVNTLATRESLLVADLIPRFLQERFLYDYQQDAKLLWRLGQVMRRVGLPPLPENLTELFPALRETIRTRRNDLMAETQIQ